MASHLTPGTSADESVQPALGAWTGHLHSMALQGRHTADIVDLGDVPADVLTYARSALAEAFMEDHREQREQGYYYRTEVGSRGST